MSRANDRAAEHGAALIRRAIARARWRIAYGKHFHARVIAEVIASIHHMLLKRYDTLQHGADALSTASFRKLLGVMRREAGGASDVSRNEHKRIVRLADLLAILLVHAALTSPKKLGLVAEAFGKLEDTGAMDDRAAAIITAYEQCESFAPTLSELKRAFIAQFGERRWRGDYSVRKTLRSLKLPLRKSKRGRPTGARSVLKMVGIPQKRRKN